MSLGSSAVEPMPNLSIGAAVVAVVRYFDR